VQGKTSYGRGILSSVRLAPVVARAPEQRLNRLCVNARVLCLYQYAVYTCATVCRTLLSGPSRSFSRMCSLSLPSSLSPHLALVRARSLPGIVCIGGVAVLLDAMRRHNEEGAKAGAKKGLKGAKGGKTSRSDGEEMVGLDGMTSMDMATATALSALIPPWLLGASGLGGGLLMEGGLLGALGVFEADMGALSQGKKQQAHEEGGEGSENEDEDMDGNGARGSSKEGASSATDAMHKKQKLEEDEEVGGDTIDTGGMGSGKRDGMEGGEDVSQGKHQEFEAALAAQMAPPAADDGSAFADIAMSMAMAAVSQVPPPPAPPDTSEADEAAYLASIAASQAAANIAAGMAAASAIKNPQVHHALKAFSQAYILACLRAHTYLRSRVRTPQFHAYSLTR